MRKIFWLIYSLLIIIILGFVIYLWRTPKKISLNYNESARLTQPIIKQTNPRLGILTAPVTVVEFANFNCPTCANVSAILKKIQSNYPNLVAIIWKDLPHPNQSFSIITHLAARCAQAQNYFWEFHDELFKDMTKRGIDSYLLIANDLGLNTRQFKDCLNTEQLRPLILSDVSEALALNLEATPSIFINGQLYNFALTEKALLNNILTYAAP